MNPQILPAAARGGVHGKTPYDECFLDSGFPRAHYVADGNSAPALASGFTRFAPEAVEMVANTAQGGGKDTWVLREEHRRR